MRTFLRSFLSAPLIAAILSGCTQEKPPANVYPIQEGFVDAHGMLMYYTSLGAGKPLVIVHGGPGASHDYFLP